MGQQQSKGELLYQQVSYGNSEGIRTLHRDGADLEVGSCQFLFNQIGFELIEIRV